MPTPRRRRESTLGKLCPPRLARAFAREGLFAELDACAVVPGVWVAGPPGMGKTTLVASYLEARALPSVWLQLDAGDADPATFAHFLGAAAALRAPRRALRLPHPGADDLRDVPGFIHRLLRRTVLMLDPPWVLVLDNIQELGSASPLHAGIAAALAELPLGVRLVALSREPAPPAYARLLAGQQLAVIDEPALRFTEADTRQLVRLHGRDWPPAELHRVTDGWAAAMILLLAARQELGPAAALQDVDTRQRLFALFADEVVRTLGPAQTATLMRVAFLPSTSAAMAVALSGDAQAGALLESLAQRGLFTERRAGTPQVFSFHALFGEFLRALALRTWGEAAERALRVEAATLLAQHGQADAAITMLVQAQAWPAARALLVAHAARFIAQGRHAFVRDSLLALPEAERSDAQAWYWLGCCELGTEPQGALRHLQRAHSGFVAAGDLRGAFYAAAAAAEAIVFVGASLDALAPWLPVLEAQAPPYLARTGAATASDVDTDINSDCDTDNDIGTDTDTDLRVLPGLLAAFVHRETAHALTATLADRAERLLDQPLGASQRLLLGTLAYYLLWTGQPLRLDRMLVKIDRLCAGPDAAPATLLRWYSVSVLIYSLLGRIDAALAHARRALALAVPGPAPLRVKAHLAMVLAAVAARDAALARVHLTEAADALDPHHAIDATTYEFQRGILMLLDGDWPRAAELMRAAVRSGQASGWPLREHIALLGQTLAATQTGAFDEAEAALQAVLAHRFHTVCVWHHWLAALIEAQLAERRGQRLRALAALTRAFALGRRHGYDFGPMPYCCGDMMPRLALLALEHGIDPPFAQALVRRHALPAPAGAGDHWPWPVRIRTLGRFVIERDAAPGTAPRKESRKPLDLLKLLIALGAVAVPVAQLSAALWPEATGDAARNSFDNALHRLRKLLGDDALVVLRAGGLSLDADRCCTDLAALEACFEEIERLAPLAAAAVPVVSPAVLPAARAADPSAALAERCLALCVGDFLPGDDELPAVLAARSRLQARFTRQMAVLGGRLAAGGQHEAAVRVYQRVVELQPLAEDIYRRLMAALVVLGRRAEAFEVYRRCRQQLSVVLGIRPARETEALAATLREA